jgi:hypothetical protein
MHHPPDLSLASSYIPACLCLFKCTVAFVLFIFSPVRGWIGLFSVLLTDRILWNQSANSTILDVNAVCVSLVGGLMVMHARADGLKTLAHFAITGAWILLSSLQVLGATRLHRAYEVLYAAFAVSALSCLYQAQERTELLALRSFVFVVANVTLPYLGVLLQHQEIDTYVNACRTLLVLLGEPEIASACAVVYILCIGYQLRGTGSAAASSASCGIARRGQNGSAKYYSASHQSPYFDDDEQPLHSVTMIEDGMMTVGGSKQQTLGHLTNPSSSSSSSSTGLAAGGTPSPSASEEAALLREALASRKGFRDA